MLSFGAPPPVPENIKTGPLFTPELALAAILIVIVVVPTEPLVSGKVKVETHAVPFKEIS